ncbi:hypothetical protein Glove_307g35 [Diversispora epigaea]|uniref:Uncharacterized protein n=1 Tax=Diversispora epigaea TaxID=1348612 RepID=A0A397HWR4_9GLOM|nr:hypothetical protein Glove_307g35 [Diversispora epigaea]
MLSLHEVKFESSDSSSGRGNKKEREVEAKEGRQAEAEEGHKAEAKEGREVEVEEGHEEETREYEKYAVASARKSPPTTLPREQHPSPQSHNPKNKKTHTLQPYITTPAPVHQPKHHITHEVKFESSDSSSGRGNKKEREVEAKEGRQAEAEEGHKAEAKEGREVEVEEGHEEETREYEKYAVASARKSPPTTLPREQHPSPQSHNPKNKKTHTLQPYITTPAPVHQPKHHITRSYHLIPTYVPPYHPKKFFPADLSLDITMSHFLSMRHP